MTISLATIVLFTLSPVLAPGSLSRSAIAGMLPFAAIMALASTGQTLVVRQRGLDLSIPGVLSVSAVLVAVTTGGDPAKLPTALGIVIAVALAAGLINGLAITWLDVTPLVATLGVNALLMGLVLQVSDPAHLAVRAGGMVNAVARAGGASVRPDVGCWGTGRWRSSFRPKPMPL